MGNEAEECATKRSLELFTGYAVNEMVTGRMSNVGARMFRQGTRGMGMEIFHFRREFRGNEMVECSVFKKLGPATRRWLSYKALSANVTQYDAV